MAIKEKGYVTNMKVDEKNDFGFSFADESEISEPVKTAIDAKTYMLQEKLDFVETQLHELYRTIIPLLTNLKRDPKKEYIKWPNRVEKIQAFEEKLESIVNRQMDLEKYK
jgi:hypothetical protein